MNEQRKDLWGNLAIQEGPVPPIVILKEQANLLDQKTNNILRGEVISLVPGFEKTEEGSKKEEIIHQFFIVVPALKNYRYELFSIKHQIDRPYPVRFIISEDYYEGQYNKGISQDESAFEMNLSKILSSNYTKSIIQNLLIQSKE